MLSSRLFSRICMTEGYIRSGAGLFVSIYSYQPSLQHCSHQTTLLLPNNIALIKQHCSYQTTLQLHAHSRDSSIRNSNAIPAATTRFARCLMRACDRQQHIAVYCKANYIELAVSSLKQLSTIFLFQQQLIFLHLFDDHISQIAQHQAVLRCHLTWLITQHAPAIQSTNCRETCCRLLTQAQTRGQRSIKQIVLNVIGQDESTSRLQAWQFTKVLAHDCNSCESMDVYSVPSLCPSGATRGAPA